MRYLNCDRYEGSLENDLKSGLGSCWYADAVYQGQWQKGLREGKSRSGAKYYGGWKNLLKDCSGVIKYPRKAVYKGEWKNDLKEGKGIYEFPSGAVHEGELLTGLKHGRGEYRHPSGARYDGEWKYGKAHGF